VDNLSIDHSTPLPVKRPTTLAELGQIIQDTRRLGQSVYPCGGRTTLDVGLPILKPGFAVDTTALNRVLDYPARDMTITAQAGLTIAELQAELAKEGQWLPVDVSQPEQATLGGAIAINPSGPHRYGYGTLRDYVIGISFMTDAGAEVKAGGRVVKNVAGYDLMKLQIGALGTLGIITQITLKLKPRPEAAAAVVFGCPDDALATVLEQLHNSQSRPVAVELLNTQARRALTSLSPLETTSPWTLVVGFEEKTATVQWQKATLRHELKSFPVADFMDVSDPSPLWSQITGLQTRRESPSIGKASALPSKLVTCIQVLAAQEPESLIHAHALNGVIWCHPVHNLNPETFPTPRRCPPEQKRLLRPKGPLKANWELMRHIKKTLDPDNVFNAGRLFGDL
jgi:glycolate oxidase FAD binding subunit